MVQKCTKQPVSNYDQNATELVMDMEAPFDEIYNYSHIFTKNFNNLKFKFAYFNYVQIPPPTSYYHIVVTFEYFQFKEF